MSPELRRKLAHRRRELRSDFPAPALHTNTAFLANRDSDPFGSGPMRESNIRMARAKAKAAGVSIEGKHYFSSMASEPWGADGWYDDKDDIARECRRRGYGCRGSVNVPAPEPISDPWPDRYEPAESLVQEEAANLLAERGVDRPTPKEREAVADEVRSGSSGAKHVLTGA